MAVRGPRKTLEPHVALHVVLTLYHAPLDRTGRTGQAARTAQGLVNLPQLADVLLRAANGKRTLRTSAAVLDAPGLPVLGDQMRRLTYASSEPG